LIGTISRIFLHDEGSGEQMRREPGSAALDFHGVYRGANWQTLHFISLRNAEPDWTTPVIEWQESRMRIARLTYSIEHRNEVRTQGTRLELSLEQLIQEFEQH
jgi:hypothetical protein